MLLPSCYHFFILTHVARAQWSVVKTSLRSDGFPGSIGVGDGGGEKDANEPHVPWIRLDPNFDAHSPYAVYAATEPLVSTSPSLAAVDATAAAEAASAASSGQRACKLFRKSEIMDGLARERRHLCRYASPVHCVVRAGETLYLPSLWYLSTNVSFRLAPPSTAIDPFMFYNIQRFVLFFAGIIVFLRGARQLP
jgi:hypothetical protein